MHLSDLPEAICFIHLAHLANTIVGVALIGHVGNHLIFIFSLTQRARLPYVMRQRLLRADVDTSLHTSQRRVEVRMIGRVNADAVDVFAQLVEHLSEVGKLRHINCPWFPGKLATINITQRDDIFPLATTVSHIGNTTCADHRKVELTVRRRPWLTNRESRKNKSTRAGGGCGFEEVSALHGDF